MKINKFIVFLSIVFIALALLTTYVLAKQNAKNILQNRIETQLQQVVNKVETTLKKHAYLPALLSFEKEIKDFVIRNNTKPLRFINGSSEQMKMNHILERNNHISETSNIYIMRLDGTTIASSNWESGHSFIGKNFSFRPYFQQASHNILGRYYAVGSVSGKRGYFFASSIVDKEKVVGVIAVKVALEEIEFTWGTGAVDFMITDASGVIFLSSQKDWNLHSLMPLSKDASDLFLQTRRYGLNPIIALENTKVNLKETHFQTIKLQNKNYEMLSKRMGLVDWHVRVMASHSSMKKSILTVMLISALILTLLTALTALLWKTQQQRKRYQQQIRIELENKVIKRTKALKQSQEDLIQAAKMAALGQLSAGITHEINNPLTAIRAYADNARLFLEKKRFDMVESNLAEISSLTESMASITRQLKSFARKSKGKTAPVLLSNAVDRALSIVRPRLANRAIICHWDKQQHGANKSVLADEVWLGQILVNLLTNAISATNEQVQAEIWITIRTGEDAQLCIQVKDNGSGIEESTLPRIFEPFFTTKPSSKGLGLGLSISFNLAKDMNGSLSAQNLENGAQFDLCLPSVK